tara:strand:- start:5174 stop:5650 length:477 start_codon:yes stop_codon:yes gene_type:complete
MYLLTLGTWLGGMVLLGTVAAPAIFQTLQISQGPGGNVLAGAVFGNVLDRFHYISYACGSLMFVSLIGMALNGSKPVAFALRSVIIIGMLALALYSGMIVSNRITQLQSEIGKNISPSTLASTDNRRIQFDRLHQLSTRLMMVNIVGALALLCWEARK